MSIYLTCDNCGWVGASSPWSGEYDHVCPHDDGTYAPKPGDVRPMTGREAFEFEAMHQPRKAVTL